MSLPSEWRAARPDVLAVLKKVEHCNWNGGIVTVSLEGTAEQLLASGACEPEMLVVGASGKRSGRDQYGDSFETKRRAGGRFEVERWFRQEVKADGGAGRNKGWRSLGPGVTAEIDSVLIRMRRPRGECTP